MRGSDFYFRKVTGNERGKAVRDSICPNYGIKVVSAGELMVGTKKWLDLKMMKNVALLKFSK